VAGIDAAVDRRVGAELPLHLLLHGGDLPAHDLEAQLLLDLARDAIGGLLVGRRQAGIEAALLTAVAAERGEKAGQLALVVVIHVCLMLSVICLTVAVACCHLAAADVSQDRRFRLSRCGIPFYRPPCK